jgi:hypothetical protein
MGFKKWKGLAKTCLSSIVLVVDFQGTFCVLTRL